MKKNKKTTVVNDSHHGAIKAALEWTLGSSKEELEKLAANARIPNGEEIARLARQGVSKRVISSCVSVVTPSTVAMILGINERTVRAYQHQEDNLSPQQAEQFLKYNTLLLRGREVFGSQEAFDRWLRKPSFGLDNECPFDLLVTSEGINLVSDEVERIANGEFA